MIIIIMTKTIVIITSYNNDSNCENDNKIYQVKF